MLKIKTICVMIAAGLLSLPLGATSAHADLVFDLNLLQNSHTSTTAGTVTLSQVDANTVSVNVELAGSPPTGETVKGDDGIFLFNLGISSNVDIVFIPPTSIPPLIALPVVLGDADGLNVAPNTQTSGSSPFKTTGNYWFEYGIQCVQALCGDGSSAPFWYGPITFEVSAVSGPLSLTDFTKDISDGVFFFAIDGQQAGQRYAGVCSATGQDSCEDDPGQNEEIPEPTTIALFGAGLLAYVGMRRRRRYLAT